MTKQEVVFCRSVFEKVKYNFEEQEIWSPENYYKNLSCVKIKTHQNNKKTLERCIKESRGFFKIFKQHLFSDNLVFIDSSSKTSFVKNVELNNLCNFAEDTLDKLIHSNNKGFWKELQKSNSRNNFEILGIDRFIKPRRESRLMASERKLDFKMGERFNFIPVFRIYLRNTRKIRIYDRYLRKRNAGFLNLNRILELCKKLVRCEIYTFNFPNGEKNNFDIGFDEFKRELQNKYGKDKIKVYSSPLGKHRRRIITDDFEIKIDPGIDSVNKKFICEKNDVEVEIKKLNN